MKRIELVEGDITTLAVDAIVNAANPALQHGGGVARAIVERGGAVIQEESDQVAPVPTGGAAVTTAGNLAARYVIHAVGPIWGEGDEDRKLAAATRAAITRAEELQLQALAFPAISAGIYGFPIDRCARVMLAEARRTLDTTRWVQRIVFCLYGRSAYDVFVKAEKELAGGE